MVALDYGARIAELRSTLADILAVVDVPSLRNRIAELETRASAPDLWDDPEVLVELVNAETDEGQAAESAREAEQELAAVEKTLGDLEVQTLLNGEYDPRPAVITIRAGAGGVDAADFAEMLLRMYLRWAEQHKYPVTVMDTSYAEEAGIKSATIEVDAPYAFGTLSVEAGTHRLVRMSPFNSAGKRQTSFAAVEVIPLMEETESIDIPENDIRVDVFRSSGPGGQSVNTTDSAVRITLLPTGIVVSMQDEKSQLQNRQKAPRVLRARLYERERERQQAELDAARRSQIRSGERAEKIRTYNYPENRVTDHRIKLTVHQLDRILQGELDEFSDALAAEERRRALEV